MYRKRAAAYLSLYFFFFLSLQFSNIKIFSQELLKLVSHMDSGQMYRVYQNQAAYSSHYFFIIAPLLKRRGYTGFALSFHDSVIL